MSIRVLLKLVLLISLLSCARIETIGMKEHRFNTIPTRIVWIQVPGLDEEQIAMLLFSKLKGGSTSFERMSCIGKSWGYNLSELRPDSGKGLLAQVLGAKNISGSCDDYKRPAIWNYLEERGFISGIIENGKVEVPGFQKALSCNPDFLGKTSVWSMNKAPKGAHYFHYLDRSDFEQGKVYFDKSCQNDVCYSELYKNTGKIWNNLISKRNQVFLLLRDNSYQNALLKRDMKKARQSLGQIERVLAQFLEEGEGRSYTIVLSSTAPSRFEFPKAGRDWAKFEKSGKNILYKRRALMSPVFASGALSENFCGIYEESSLLKRFLWTPQKRKFLFNILDF